MKETPLEIEGVFESIYAGFWVRLGSLFLDAICFIPVAFFVLFLNTLDKNMYYFTVAPLLAFGLWFSVYLPWKLGGTPGKLALDIVIIRIDGRPIGLKEAFLRNSVEFGLAVLHSLAMMIALMNVDVETYEGVGWLERPQFLASFSPILFTIYNWVSNGWTWSEF